MFRDKPARTKAWQYIQINRDRGVWRTLANDKLTYPRSDVPANLNWILNHFGSDGWEAVHFKEDNGVIDEVIFKREMRRTLNEIEIRFGFENKLFFPHE